MTVQWVSFHKDRRVTIFTGRVELGQGVSSALIRIAAGELGLHEDQIDLVSGDTSRVPNEGSTVGSLSIQVGGMAVRHAASAARWECLKRAGALLQTSPTHLQVELGTILKDGLDTGLNYWGLTRDAPLAGRVAEFAKPVGSIGQKETPSLERRSDMLERLRGHAFIHDLTFPGMLHGRMVHPPFGAMALDASTEDIAGCLSDGVDLFRDGMLIGVTSEQEHGAARAIERLRERLAWKRPKRDDPEGALQGEGTPETVYSIGELPDTDAMATVSLARPCIAHASIGSCCAVALFQDNSLQIWSHSQGVFSLRESLAAVLDLVIENVTVRHVPGAGCYGHNGADDVALDAALLAREYPGRHVRVIWSRLDEFQSGPLSPAMKTTAEAWLSDTGTLDAFRVSVRSPGHSTRPLGAAAPNLRAAAFMATPIPIGPSKDAPFEVGGGSERNGIPIYRSRGRRLEKHHVTETPYRSSALRGLGAQVNIAVIEGLMDDLARLANSDPVSFRLAHLEDERARAAIEAARDMSGGLECPDGHARGLGFARYKNSSGYFACIVEVRIDEDVTPIQVWAAADVGEVIDISGTKNQLEGGVMQALSIVLREEVGFQDGINATFGWEDYPILGFDHVPEIEISILNQPSEPPLGCGEIAIGPTTAAVMNAATCGLGIRPNAMPLNRENLVALLSG